MQRFYDDEGLVEQYEVFRPAYPNTIVTEVLKFLDEQNPGEKRRGFMLDVGCGGGQATRLFAPHFKKILGIDISTSQINMAKKTVPNIEFKIGSASDFQVESGSVDLVIAGTAVHYFDLDAFLSECDRVLQSGGCVALFAYWPCKLKTPQGKIIARSIGDSGISRLAKIYDEDIGVSAYIINVLEQRYQPIYDRINKKCKRLVTGLEMDTPFTVDQYINYLATIGQYHSNKDRFEGTNPLVTARKQIEMILGLRDDKKYGNKEYSFQVTFEYPIVLFRK